MKNLGILLALFFMPVSLVCQNPKPAKIQKQTFQLAGLKSQIRLNSASGLTGYLKIPGIPGESRRADHEGEIDIHAVQFVNHANVSRTSGRSSGAVDASPILIGKMLDSSTPYLMQANFESRRFNEVVISLRKDSGDAHLDYLTITLENVRISSFEANYGDENGFDSEIVALHYESIKVIYVEQEDDHSRGDEHEMEYSLRTGS